MKREKRHCRVARSHPLTDLEAIEDDLLGFEVYDDQRLLMRKMQKLQRLKSYMHFLLMMVVVATCSGVFGLRSGISQTTANSFAHPFSNLDPALTPSGILHNRSPWYHRCFVYDTLSNTMVLNPDWKASPYLFEGGQISMKPETFVQLYQDMLAAQINDSVLINPTQYRAAWEHNMENSDLFLSLMAIEFERLPEDALLGGRVWFDTLTGQFGAYPDTLWLPDTLITDDTTIVADTTYFVDINNSDSLLSISLSKHLLFGSRISKDFIFVKDTSITLRFCVPSTLFVSNIDTLVGISIDLDDSGGFRNVPWDTTLLITYNFLQSPKIQTKQIKVKLPFINYDLLLMHTLKFVVNTIDADTVIITDSLPYLCQPLTGSTAAEGKISILFSSPAENKLIKPVLFVEGFETATQPYGDINFQNVVNKVMPEIGFGELEELPLFFNTLLQNGYDLVYLDFKNARDSLDCNMLAVYKTIQWINDQLFINGSQEKLVVAAASMGGILARYALRKMELDGCCHNTRLYISFDAPHLGANIPIGLQHLVKQAAMVTQSWNGSSGIIKWLEDLEMIEVDLRNPKMTGLFENVLNSPAARAMLIQHVDPDAMIFHKSFYAMLDSIGYPKYCRNIALINGSENGVLHKLEDSGNRLIGTGKQLRVPYEWQLKGPGLNAPDLYNYYPTIITNHHFAYSMVMAESMQYFYVSNDWGASVDNINSSITKIMWHTSLNHIYGGLALAVGPGEPLTYFYLDGLMAKNKKTGNNALAKLLVPGTLQQISSTGIPHLTTAPGGLNDALKKLGDAANEYINVYSKKFSFVPSVSALGVKNVPLDENLKTSYVSGQLNGVPFDAYWAPKRVDIAETEENQMHVEINEVNREWLFDHINHDWELGSNSQRYYGILSSSYNYGRPSIGDINDLNQPYQRILYSLDIVQGGVLHVNRQAEIGLQGSMLFPKPNDSFHLDTDGNPCDPSHVRVMQGGEMVLGDPLNYNTATVDFNPNSILELFPGSKLTLHHDSRLIIAEGATFIVHPGAEIVLVNTGSVLEMKGRLVLTDNTHLSVSGLGYLCFNTPMTAATHQLYFVAGTGSSIDIKGGGKCDRKLDIASDTWFPGYLPVTITDAMVTIAEGRSLAFTGPVQLNNLWVRPVDTTSFYEALVLYGQPDVSVTDCIFSHGYYGVRANLAIGGTPLAIEDCVFRGNFHGLYTIDERVRLIRCTLNNNILTGWLAENMAGQSVTENSGFSMNGQAGIRFSGQVNASLILSNSVIEQNLNGVHISDGLLQAACSRIAYNSYAGIMAGKNARLKFGLSTRNHIVDNYIGIALNKALELDIMNGYQKFSGNDFYIIGELLPNLYLNIQQNTLIPVNLSGNHMPVINNAIPVNIYIEHPVMLTTMTLPIIFTNNINHFFTNCIQTPNINEHLLAPITGIAGASVVPGGRYTNYFFADALYQAAMNLSCDGYPGNDTLAISALADLLNNLPVLMNDAEREGVDYGLQLMTTALGNAIAGGQIDPNRGIEGVNPDEYVAMIMERIQESFDNVDPQNIFAEEQEARYALMMAQMFRVAEHYDYALELLEDGSLFEGTTYGDDAAYWGCVCRAEELMVRDSIDRIAYRNKLDSCSLYLSIARILPFMPFFGETNLDNLQQSAPLVENIFPNPATRRIVVELSRNATITHTELYDMSGRVLFESKPLESVKEFVIDLPDLHLGAYMLKVYADGESSMHKLLISAKK